MKTRQFVVAALICVVAMSAGCRRAEAPGRTETDDTSNVSGFLADANAKLLTALNNSNEAGWVMQTYINADTQAISARADEAYVSALTTLGFDVDIGPWTFVHEPWPVMAGFVLAVLISGLCGYLIGKLSFRVRGAYFVIVTISFAEVVRLVALNWVDLTQ